MNKIEQQVECVNCQWNKLCIEPPSMTEDEVKTKIKLPEPDGNAAKDDGKLMSGMMSVLFFSGKDRECVACPVLIEKLREGPDFSNRIKEIMKSY